MVNNILVVLLSMAVAWLAWKYVPYVYLVFWHILDIMSQLGNAQQGPIDSRVLQALGMISLVEVLDAEELGKLGSFHPRQALDLLPQGVPDLLEERVGQNASLRLAEELGQEAMGISGLVSKEEICQLVSHGVDLLTWIGAMLCCFLLRDEAKGGRSSSIYTVLQHGRVTRCDAIRWVHTPPIIRSTLSSTTRGVGRENGV